MGTILFVLIIAFAALGLIIGFVKGFTNVKSWGVEYLVAVAAAAGIGTAASKIGGDNSPMPAVLTIAVTVAALLVAMLLMAGLRGLIKKRRKKRYERALDEYEDSQDGMGDFEDDDYDDDYYEDDDGMDDSEDEAPKKKKKHKKKKAKSKKRPKEPKGACGFIDRLLGAIVLAVKGAVMALLIISIFLLFVDLAQIDALTNMFASMYEQQLWVALKPNVMNMLIVFIMMLCIKNGFESGVINTLWSLVSLALIVGAGYLSYHLAFNVSSFQPAAEGLASKLEGVAFIKQITEMVPAITSLVLAKAVITAGLFVVLLIVVIIIKLFVPKLIMSARDSNIVYGLDGFLGALLMSAIVLGVLLFLGFLLEAFNDFEFMVKFNTYFEKGGIASYFYGNNVLTTLNVLPDLTTKIRDFFNVAA